MYVGPTKVWPPAPSYQQPSGFTQTPDTPDLAVNVDRTWVARLSWASLTDATVRVIACQRPGSGNVDLGFQWSKQGTDKLLLGVANTAGTGWINTNTAALAGAVNVGDTVTLAASIQLNNGAGGNVVTHRLLVGSTWTVLGTLTAAGVATPFNSVSTICVGSWSTGGQPWDGNIYWVEQRTGLDPAAGSVVWRFDAQEHISGTTWTDARGRLWTVNNKAQVVHP